MPKKVTEFGHLSPANAVFRTKDNRKITIAALEDVYWEKLCNVLQLHKFADDEKYSSNSKRVKNGKIIYEHLQKIFLNKTSDEWIKILDRAGIPSGPVYTYDETFEDPHITQRCFFAEIPYRGDQILRQVGFPIKFSNFSPKIYLPPPEMGEHTEGVLLEEGFSKEEIEVFRKHGII